MMEQQGQCSKHYRVNDVVFHLSSDDNRILELMERRLPPGSEPTDPSETSRPYRVTLSAEDPQAHDLRAGEEELVRAARLDTVLNALESDFDIWLAANTSDWVLIHAGVVGWRGRAMVFPGSSYSGKTTLVSELIKAGAHYYSDDYAIFDRDGLVLPFPRPLAVRHRGGGRSEFSPEVFGAVTASDPIPVGLVAVTQYRWNAVWSPRSLSRGEMVLSMLHNAPAARSRPAAVISRMDAALRNARCIAGERGEAAVLARELVEICADWGS